MAVYSTVNRTKSLHLGRSDVIFLQQKATLTVKPPFIIYTPVTEREEEQRKTEPQNERMGEMKCINLKKKIRCM